MNSVLSKHIKKYITGFIRFLFPNYCQNCHKLLSSHDKNCFCDECWNSIKLIKENFCIKCGKPVITANGICNTCKKNKFYYKQIRVVGIYEKILKNAIHLYKYFFRWKISKDFSDLNEKNIDRKYITNNDYIIPVPVTHKDLMKKGFYHTFLVTKMISQKYNLPVIKNLIVKTRQTLPQSSLKRKERLTNLKDAFRINKKYQNKISNKKLLLFDDVYTTGSTVQEISKELSQYKVKNINVLAIARGK